MSVQGFLQQVALCLSWGAGEENGIYWFLCSQRTPPTYFEININRSPSHCVSCCFPPGCCLFKDGTWVSPSLPACQVLSHLSFTAPGSKSCWYKCMEFNPFGFQGQMLGGRISGVGSLVLSPFLDHSCHLQTAPGQLSLFLTSPVGLFLYI